MLRCVNPVLRRWVGVSTVGSCTVVQDRPPVLVAAMTPKPSGVLPRRPAPCRRRARERTQSGGGKVVGAGERPRLPAVVTNQGLARSIGGEAGRRRRPVGEADAPRRARARDGDDLGHRGREDGSGPGSTAVGAAENGPVDRRRTGGPGEHAQTTGSTVETARIGGGERLRKVHDRLHDVAGHRQKDGDRSTERIGGRGRPVAGGDTWPDGDACHVGHARRRSRKGVHRPGGSPVRRHDDAGGARRRGAGQALGWTRAGERGRELPSRRQGRRLPVEPPVDRHLDHGRRRTDALLRRVTGRRAWTGRRRRDAACAGRPARLPRRLVDEAGDPPRHRGHGEMCDGRRCCAAGEDAERGDEHEGGGDHGGDDGEARRPSRFAATKAPSAPRRRVPLPTERTVARSVPVGSSADRLTLLDAGLHRRHEVVRRRFGPPLTAPVLLGIADHRRRGRCPGRALSSGVGVAHVAQPLTEPARRGRQQLGSGGRRWCLDVGHRARRRSVLRRR